MYNPGQNISDKLWFLCEIAPYRKNSNYYFFNRFFFPFKTFYNNAKKHLKGTIRITIT